MAEDLDQARQKAFSSMNINNYPELVDFIKSHEPRSYEDQTGWLKEICSQYI